MPKTVFKRRSLGFRSLGSAFLVLLSCWPGAAAAQLLWEAEPEPTPQSLAADADAPAPSVASALVWEAEPDPPALWAEQPDAAASGDSIARGELPDTSQPLSPEDVQALLLGLPEPYSPPNLSGGLPAAYVANWGDFYITGSAGTPGKQRDSQPDGSVGAGIGFGNDQELIAVELNWGVGSINNFNANGAFNLFASRMLLNEPRLQVLVGGGVFDFYTYGNEKPQPDPTGYGVLTVALPLREPNFEFNQVLQLSAGVGGRDFAALDANFRGGSTSAFGAIGVELAPNVGLSAGISGRGTNINLSYTPFRELPISINVLAADVFDQSPFGTVGVLTVSWGDNFRRGLF
ncbi:hypothetical protein KBY96_13570 [Cyanobium sp. ATX 6A2]|uniref:hypothetical protein n=1 Tax=Cyanobium sp. ATX 6A2 TaxID=2823700 RepID=UPI0020CC4BCB|nr:hypothetical protein [Cyanobium sp. ATX 6A2]MCP9888954.1 hypothetical protein [Cyanobium sp. ATX 6A2]